MPEKTLTVNIDGDPSLLNKKIENAAKNPVNLKVDFNSKDLMSGLNEIKSAASKISDSIGKDFSKIFRGIGKDKMPMQDALNEIKNNIASVITDIGTAENQLNAIRVSPGGEGFEELRANIDGIRTSIDGISKINLSALAPPDSAIQKLSEVRSQIESLSEVDKLESYLTRGANRYAKSGLLNNSYYENMKKYVDMGGKLSDISHKESGNLSNYLKEYTQMANAVTSTGKSVSFIDNNEISGAVEQLRQLRVEEQALSQTSGGLNLLGNIKQMTDSISQISALLHTQFNAEPIKLDFEPNIDGLDAKIQGAMEGKKIQVDVEAKSNPTLMDQINSMAGKDPVTNIGISVGKAQDPIEKNRLYGQASRTAIKEMRTQVTEMEKELQIAGGKRYASADPTSAAWGIMSKSGISSGNNLFEAIQEAGRTDLSLTQQVSALSNYMNLLSRTAEKIGIDFSKYKTPQDFANYISSSSSSSSIANSDAIVNAIKGEKQVASANIMPDEASLSGFTSAIQSAVEGTQIKVPLEPNLEGFVEKIQGAVGGVKVDPSQIISNGKTKTDTNPKAKAEQVDGTGEGRGDMYRGQTALIRRQNVDLSGYNEQFQSLGLGDFKRLATFGEDGDAIITFMSGVGEAATETTIRVEDLVETVGKLKAGIFGHEDYKNEFSKADQDAIKKFNNEQKLDLDRENMYKSLQRSDDRSDLANYKTGLKNQLLGIENNSEQIAALDRVRGKYDEITSSVQNLEGENLKYADSVRGIEEGIYRSVTNSISSDYNKLSESKYADRDEYKQKLVDYKSFMNEINSKSIDFGNKSQVDNFRTIISLIQTLKSEMSGLSSEYAKQDAEASKAGKAQADALKQQQKLYQARGKEIRKNLYEGLTGEAQKELTDAFSGKQFEKFGLFDSAKVNKDGSAVLSFVKEIDGSLQKVTVTAANANGALNALKMGRFEQYATDYQTGKITQSPEQKSDIKNYQSALIAEAKGMELTGIQTSALDKIRTEYQAIVGDIDNATNAQRAFVASVQEAGANATKAISDSLTKDYNKLASGAENMLPGYSEKLDELKSHIETINGMTIDWDDEKQKADLQDQLSKVMELKAEMTSGAYTPASESSINALMQRMSTTERYNSKAFRSAEFGGQLKDLKERIGFMSTSKTSTLDVKNANSELSKLIANFQEGQKAGASFGDTWRQRMGSLGAYLTTFASFYRIIATIKKIANTVKELDAAMIELEKVSDVSGERLQQSFETSKETAQDLGASVTETINATADWSRLGYSQDQAEELAKVAIIYKHVGDGIDIDAANESLISTLQGFKMEASDAMEIVDKFNEVANNEPIDSAGIGEALQRSAASFQAANTDLSESIALITSANAVVQDPSRVGNMWKTVSMRIRGKIVPIYNENYSLCYA